eukprot:366153-Chlamydomonas_euryale.AAC.3
MCVLDTPAARARHLQPALYSAAAAAAAAVAAAAVAAAAVAIAAAGAAAEVAAVAAPGRQAHRTHFLVPCCHGLAQAPLRYDLAPQPAPARLPGSTAALGPPLSTRRACALLPPPVPRCHVSLLRRLDSASRRRRLRCRRPRRHRQRRRQARRQLCRRATAVRTASARHRGASRDAAPPWNAHPLASIAACLDVGVAAEAAAEYAAHAVGGSEAAARPRGLPTEPPTTGRAAARRATPPMPPAPPPCRAHRGMCLGVRAARRATRAAAL